MHRFLDLEEDTESMTLLDEFGITPDQTPVMICAQGVDRRPTIKDVARKLGLDQELDAEHVYDVVVIGGGPGGLALRFTPRRKVWTRW